MPSCPWSRLSAGPTGCPLQTPWRRGPTCLQWATGVAKQLPRRRATSPAPRAPAPLPLAPLRAHARRPRRAPSSARRCLRRRWHTVARPTFSIQTSIGANFQHSNFQIPRKLPERHVSVARRCRYVVFKLVAERNLHVVFQKAHAAGGKDRKYTAGTISRTRSRHACRLS